MGKRGRPVKHLPTKHVHVGPGGMACSCCTPAPPGSPVRRKWVRAGRRREAKAHFASQAPYSASDAIDRAEREREANDD